MCCCESLKFPSHICLCVLIVSFLPFGLKFLMFPFKHPVPKRCEVKNTLQVIRDPRWGRCYESYSEDSEVVRKMSCLVTGLQGPPPEGHPHGYPFLAGR